MRNPTEFATISEGHLPKSTKKIKKNIKKVLTDTTKSDIIKTR